MRYLKTYGKFTDVHYKLFEMIVEEEDLPYFDDVKDRFLELEDDGFLFEVSQVNDKPLDFGDEIFIYTNDVGHFTYGESKEMIEITMKKRGNTVRRIRTFTIDSVKDVLESTIDMLGKYGFRFDSYYVSDYNDTHKVNVGGEMMDNAHGYFKDIDDMEDIPIIKLSLYLIKDDVKSVDESKDWDKKFTCSIFDLSKELRDEVSDVLLELEDLGYGVTFEPFADTSTQTGDDTCPSIDILYTEKQEDIPDDVKEVIERITQISKDYGWVIDTWSHSFGVSVMFIR